jgi:hypothetical protein
MQIAGNKCLVCSQAIGVMRDGAGCLRCQSVFHKTCLTQEVCPNCGESLLSTETVHATPVGSSLVAGIGGWLVLPAIGLGLGPIVGAVALVAALLIFADVKAAGYGALYALELTWEASFLLLVLHAATRFFGKKRDAPSVVIRVLVVGLAGGALLLVAAVIAGAPVFVTENAKQLGRDIVGAAIWIPYFRVSKRVKATFVN